MTDTSRKLPPGMGGRQRGAGRPSKVEQAAREMGNRAMPFCAHCICTDAFDALKKLCAAVGACAPLPVPTGRDVAAIDQPVSQGH